MMARSEVEDVLRSLLRDGPDLRGGDGDAAGRPAGARLLAWLVGEVPLGGTTLETGCGASTVVLGALARAHVAVAPAGDAHGRIRAWCAAHGVDLAAATLVDAPTEVHIPAAIRAGDLADESLDLVLVGGDPAFPVPALEWYLTAPLLKVGGLVVVGGTDVRASALVADFLSHEEDRWRLRHRVDEAAVFEKLSGDLRTRGCDQPWNRATPSVDARLRALRSQVRRLTRRGADAGGDS